MKQIHLVYFLCLFLENTHTSARKHAHTHMCTHTNLTLSLILPVTHKENKIPLIQPVLNMWYTSFPVSVQSQVQTMKPLPPY